MPALHGMFVLQFLVGLICLVTGLNLFSLKTHQAGLVLVLFSLAMLAELFPLEMSGRRVRISFTMPYVAAATIVLGSASGITLDVCATLVAGLIYPRLMRRRPSALWALFNASLAAFCTSMGALFIRYLPQITDNSDANILIKSLAFMTVYGGINFLTIAATDSYVSQKGISENVLSTLNLGARAFMAYALFAIPVTLLSHENSLILLVLTFVPLWALRTGLSYQAKMYDHYYETISSLNTMLQRAHPYTHGHLERVAQTAEMVARRLGMSHARARLVREAALLHDIGKIAVSEEILDKPAKLTEEEFAHVKNHSEWGAQILEPCAQLGDMVKWIRHHHERPDGKGYPHGLSGDEIPIESRIIAIVDAYDAMVDSPGANQTRTYRKPKTSQEAIIELENCSGTQFDGAIVAIFKEVIEGETAK